MLHVLILCTHNSARSALFEAMLNHWAQRRGVAVRAFSAGSAPSGRTNPYALAVLDAAGVATDYLTSKSWDVFSGAGAPEIDIVLTVCDSAAGEACPLFVGAAHQTKAHWGYADPSNVPEADDARLHAFELTRQAIGYRAGCLLDFAAGLAADAGDGTAIKAAWQAMSAEQRAAALAQIAAQ